MPTENHEDYQVTEYFRKLCSRFKPGRVDRQMVFYFELEDERWTVTVGPESCDVAEGKIGEGHDCFLRTTKEILVKTVRGQYTPTFSDLLTGKIRTDRPDLLAMFKQVFID
jgi:hypothetical protein